MIICFVNANVLLPCLCVLCALLIAGIVTMSVLIARRNAYNAKIMQRDVYARENANLNADCDELSGCNTVDSDGQVEKVGGDVISD